MIGRSEVKQYAVIYEKGREELAAYVPDLPGCISTGETRAEVERNIKDAIEYHIEGLKEDGQAVPEPASEVGIVQVA